ncbi:MAG: hypothetical protein IT380_05540 [Myxococcales bacterium]|nr:hypothetical protein [Myxococcales bacterium]
MAAHPEPGELLDSKVDVHDRRQFELKLEYQPSGTDDESEYLVETLLFVPASLNVTQDTWPRDRFYADLHNYVRLKTPVLSFDELLGGRHSPLVQLEDRKVLGLVGSEAEVVWDAKMLACTFRGALRRFARGVKKECSALLAGADSPRRAPAPSTEHLHEVARASIHATQEVLRRYRSTAALLAERYALSERTRTALRLVDEYLSLQVEQYFRRVVVNMEALPKEGDSAELRRELMDVVLSDESYRKLHKLPSVLAPGTDNEEYSHRISFLKKFCQNILFLKVHRSSPRKKWEEVLFSLAAGGAMAFALGVGLFAQSRYPQASFNFFVIAVMGYMLKDRIKEGLRRFFSEHAGRFLYERTTRIIDPVTQDEVGVCHEKVDYGVLVPEDVQRLRHRDDLLTVAQGELGESVIRYRKKIVLDSDMLPRLADGIVSGITDIIRVNVDTLLHDMDDPEFELDYVDLDDFSVEKVRLAKSYRVDVAFRCSLDDGAHKRTTVRVVRLVLDRNGIKRMTDLVPETVVAQKSRRPSAATPAVAAALTR